eukprot:6171831-Pleurochrysis_carterae.AAC.3
MLLILRDEAVIGPSFGAQELVARVAGESGADKCAVWTSLQCLRRAKGKGAAARGAAVLQVRHG